MRKVNEKAEKTGSAYRIVRSSTIYTAKMFSKNTKKIFHYFQLITEMLHRAQPRDENQKSVHLVSAPEASGENHATAVKRKNP